MEKVTLQEALRAKHQGCTCDIGAGRDGYVRHGNSSCPVHGRADKKKEEARDAK